MNLTDYDHMPSVAALMTPFPHFVGPDDPIARVADLMHRHGIRHAPVREGDRVVGIVSERDLRAVRGQADAPSGAALAVRDVQVPDPYTVELSAPLDGVLREMALRRIGAAVIVRHGKLAGILTVVDVCRSLAQILEDRFGSPDAA